MNQPYRRLRYTDLNVWKKSMELSREVCAVLKQRGFSGSGGLKAQLERSVSSVPSNIAEGEGQPTNRASLKFYSIARGSLNEVRSQLAEALARNCLSFEQHRRLESLAEESSKLIAGVIKVRKAREDASQP